LLFTKKKTRISVVSGHIFQQNFSTGLSVFFPTLPLKSCQKFPLPPLLFTLDFKISSPQLTCSIALLIFCSHAEDLLFPKIRPCFSIQALSLLFAWRLYVIEALSLRCIINTTPDPSYPTRRFSRPHSFKILDTLFSRPIFWSRFAPFFSEDPFSESKSAFLGPFQEDAWFLPIFKKKTGFGPFFVRSPVLCPFFTESPLSDPDFSLASVV